MKTNPGGKRQNPGGSTSLSLKFLKEKTENCGKEYANEKIQENTPDSLD